MNNERYEYSPIVRRPPLRWPNGARVAVWVIPNVEHFHLDHPAAGAQPGRPPQVPDARNVGWRDYGLRVGIWRIMGLLDKYRIRATVALNAEVCDLYPAIIEEGVKRDWEFMGHGLTNSQPLYGLDEPTERAVIGRTLDRIQQATGRRPRGWLGPGLAENFGTPELLAEAGVEYVGDWCADDQPFPLRLERGRLLAMPYTVELNDLPFFITHNGSGPQFYDAIRDQFDVLYEEGATTARVMAIALHTFVIGQPHRSKYLDQALAHVCGHRDVWLATGAEIADAYYAQGLEKD